MIFHKLDLLIIKSTNTPFVVLNQCFYRKYFNKIFIKNLVTLILVVEETLLLSYMCRSYLVSLFVPCIFQQARG